MTEREQQPFSKGKSVKHLRRRGLGLMQKPIRITFIRHILPQNTVHTFGPDKNRSGKTPIPHPLLTVLLNFGLWSLV